MQRLFNDFARRVRKVSGYEWYSRVKLWDEAQLINKMPVDLTDDEFKRALYNINMFCVLHKAVALSWQLEPYKGPQSIDDRNDPERLNYLRTPTRYMWYLATIFKQELTAWARALGRPSVTATELSEADFVELLRRTSACGGTMPSFGTT